MESYKSEKQRIKSGLIDKSTGEPIYLDELLCLKTPEQRKRERNEKYKL